MQLTKDCCWRHSIVKAPARTAAIVNVAFWHAWHALAFRVTTRSQKNGPSRGEYLRHAARLAALAVVFGEPGDRVGFMRCPCGRCNSVGLSCDINPEQLVTSAALSHLDITKDVEEACSFFEAILAAYQVTQDSDEA